MSTEATYTILKSIRDIDLAQWNALVMESPTATWFQTREAYDFFASLPEEMDAFVYGVAESGLLKGIVVGYVTRERNVVKQLFTRRAIVVGGPLLDASISEEALCALLLAVRKSLSMRSIYIETRNFNDYSRWKNTFLSCGFRYEAHLNFHIDTSSTEVINANMGKNRKRDIRTSFREGCEVVQHPTLEQVNEFYGLLSTLYKSKIRTPLFSFCFFKQLYKMPHAHFLLVAHGGEIVGGTVVLELPNRSLYEWFVCGRDGEIKAVFPSSVATYVGICKAEELGCKRFDMMGAGTPSETYGVRDFKARFGGALVEYGRYVCVNNRVLYQFGKLGVWLMKRGFLSGGRSS